MSLKTRRCDAERTWCLNAKPTRKLANTLNQPKRRKRFLAENSKGANITRSQASTSNASAKVRSKKIEVLLFKEHGDLSHTFIVILNNRCATNQIINNLMGAKDARFVHAIDHGIGFRSQGQSNSKCCYYFNMQRTAACAGAAKAEPLCACRGAEF